MKRLVLLMMVLFGCEGDGSPDVDAPVHVDRCDRYLQCVAQVAPAELAKAVEGYGADGSCWGEEAALCHEACEAATEQLWAEFPGADACAPCRSDAECGEGNACSPQSQTCVDCYEDDAQCGEGRYCAADSTCVACLDDAHCETGHCDDQTCVACTEDAHCPSGYCKDNTCVECTSNPHCDSGRCQANACQPCDATSCPGHQFCASSGACEDALFPLVDASWSYRVTKTGTGEYSPFHFCEDEEHVHSERFGSTVLFLWFCRGPSGGGSAANWFWRGEGDRLMTGERDGHHVPFLDTPLSVGHEWATLDGTKVRWYDHGPVTTPAGTFDDCWTRQHQTGTTLTFCRGIGLARAAYLDASGDNGFVAELLSYDPL